METLKDVEIQNVVIASCIVGSLSDLRAAANVLRGRTFADGVRLAVTPSTESFEVEVTRKEGY